MGYEITERDGTATFRYRASQHKINNILYSTHDPNLEAHSAKHTKNPIAMGFQLEAVAKKAADELVKKVLKNKELVYSGHTAKFRGVVPSGSVVIGNLNLEGNRVKINLTNEKGEDIIKDSYINYCMIDSLPSGEKGDISNIEYQLTERNIKMFLRGLEPTASRFYELLIRSREGFKSLFNLGKVDSVPPMYPLSLISNALGEECKKNVIAKSDGKRIIYTSHKFDVYRGLYNLNVGDALFLSPSIKNRGNKNVAKVSAVDRERNKLYDAKINLIFV
ncbi:MAG: hypothetical protein KAU20_00775 [Nanoarchaeota archaeon]|nr:hypothetical protein [Nanoarchaeota archaeon]